MLTTSLESKSKLKRKAEVHDLNTNVSGKKQKPHKSDEKFTFLSSSFIEQSTSCDHTNRESNTNSPNISNYSNMTSSNSFILSRKQYIRQELLRYLAADVVNLIYLYTHEIDIFRFRKLPMNAMSLNTFETSVIQVLDSRGEVLLFKPQSKSAFIFDINNGKFLRYLSLIVPEVPEQVKFTLSSDTNTDEDLTWGSLAVRIPEHTKFPKTSSTTYGYIKFGQQHESKKVCVKAGWSEYFIMKDNLEDQVKNPDYVYSYSNHSNIDRDAPVKLQVARLGIKQEVLIVYNPNSNFLQLFDISTGDLLQELIFLNVQQLAVCDRTVSCGSSDRSKLSELWVVTDRSLIYHFAYDEQKRQINIVNKSYEQKKHAATSYPPTFSIQDNQLFFLQRLQDGSGSRYSAYDRLAHASSCMTILTLPSFTSLPKLSHESSHKSSHKSSHNPSQNNNHSAVLKLEPESLEKCVHVPQVNTFTVHGDQVIMVDKNRFYIACVDAWAQQPTNRYWTRERQLDSPRYFSQLFIRKTPHDFELWAYELHTNDILVYQ